VSRELGLVFPCEIPIKIFGHNVPSFKAAVLEIIRSHDGALTEDDLQERPSRAGTYLSLTVSLRVESRAEADRVYGKLTASDDILMVL
jgi:putative lipoic acid-binding regulatory protein